MTSDYKSEAGVKAADFSTTTFGKWILAGEHSVLRGVPALVFPAKHFSMNFSYSRGSEALRVDFLGSKGDELKLIFWGLVEHALNRVSRDRADLKGQLRVESSLPLGAGLGASGALCVGIGQFFNYLGWIEQKDIYEFSRQLENLFHGESSGVDIAIALEGRGLRFQRGGERTPVEVSWSPELYLSFSGKRGMTSECVKRVNELRERNIQMGEKLDQQMREAVDIAEKALASAVNVGTPQATQAPLDQTRLELLAKSLDLARDCFYQWGLCEGPLDQHMRELIRQGALAVKPTGSGGGGYVLSLFRERPVHLLKGDSGLQLIPLF